MFARREYNTAFCELLTRQVSRAEQILRWGVPLVERVPRALRIDVALFIGGGLAILEAIRRQNYDVWRRRPEVSKLARLRLFLSAWWRHRGAGGQ
jgi:phytoene/squalene synthetase